MQAQGKGAEISESIDCSSRAVVEPTEGTKTRGLAGTRKTETDRTVLLSSTRVAGNI